MFKAALVCVGVCCGDNYLSCDDDGERVEAHAVRPACPAVPAAAPVSGSPGPSANDTYLPYSTNYVLVPLGFVHRSYILK